MEFKEMLKERKAAEEAEKAKSQSTNEKEASGLQASEGEATADGTTNGEQAQELTNENAKSEDAKTEAAEKSDHINGEIESHLHNGDCATHNVEEKCQSSSESQSKLNNIMTSANGTESESAVMNGNECDVKKPAETE